MASLNIISIDGVDVRWSITGLGNNWNSTNYSYCGICTGTMTAERTSPPSGIIDEHNAPSTGTNNYTSTYTDAHGLSSGSDILYAYVYAPAVGKWYPAGSASVVVPVVATKLPSPNAPTLYSGSETYRYEGGFRADWNIVSGSDGYRLKVASADGSFLTYFEASSSDYDISPGTLAYGTQYNISVKAYSPYGLSYDSSYSVSNPITTKPKKPTLTIYPEPTSIGVLVTGLDGIYDDVEVYLYNSSMTLISTKIVLDNGFAANFTGLTQGTRYYVDARTTQGSLYSFYTAYKTIDTPIPPATPTGLYVQGVTVSSVNYNWNTVSGATGYDMEFRRVGYSVETSYTTNNYKNFTGLLQLTEYELRVRAYNSNGDSAWTSWVRGTTLTGRPSNWAWEFTISSGGAFYSQSGNSIYLMRASHWNDFTTRINDFRFYKGLAVYSFTTATTSTTQTGIKTCINQAITAINAMGFAQSSLSSGNNVAASTFTTMRNNLNSIV